MSQVIESPPANEQAGEKNLPVARPAARGRSVLIWGIVGTLLLAGSGTLRSVQSSYYDESTDLTILPPFPLKQIPKTLDGWRLVEGSEKVLDPLTTRITGSTDHILGNYINEETGVMLAVLMLFGPAEPVVPHTPEICYPATGYKAAGGSVDRDIVIAGPQNTKFRSNVFVKSGGRNLLQKTVYYSFRHDGVWVPWVSTKNSPRKNPGIYKIQIDRQMAPGEARFEDEPIEDFVKKLVPVLEAMIRKAGPAGSQGAAVATR